MIRVDLITTGPGSLPPWTMGETHSPERPLSPTTLVDALTRVEGADAVLLWDPALGVPDPQVISELAEQRADVHHGGLQLGQRGQPRVIDFIEPLWMFNCDATSEIESTSWRMSFRACLIKKSVLTHMRGPMREFHSLEGAALELGMRWIRRGVFIRHTPRLCPKANATPANLDVHDELLFAHQTFGSSWAMWAAARGVLTRAWTATAAAREVRSMTTWPSLPKQTFTHDVPDASSAGTERVSVIVPTIERYPYLRVLLAQLRTQTVPPAEVIVIDQTPKEDREPGLRDEFADLPLIWIDLDQAGQCSSRNLGLQRASGDYLLFVDDDDEIKPDLIELHLRAFARFGGDASCGIAHEVGISGLPENFGFTRASDVFPTNNTMVKRSLLERSGLFDLAFDRQQRADADLGMRAYLSGAMILLHPEIDVLHHHAPRGGLRKHGARVVTYASSRKTIAHRHLPSPSELYLAGRYFGERQAREFLWQRAMGTLSSHGSVTERFVKGLAGAIRLADTVRQMHRVKDSAREMLAQTPEIPRFASGAS